jgi:hypothetical protein
MATGVSIRPGSLELWRLAGQAHAENELGRPKGQSQPAIRASRSILIRLRTGWIEAALSTNLIAGMRPMLPSPKLSAKSSCWLLKFLIEINDDT